MRVSEYYPYGIVEKDSNGNIKSVKESYFESDYASCEKEQLEETLENIVADEHKTEVQAMKIRVLSLED